MIRLLRVLLPIVVILSSMLGAAPAGAAPTAPVPGECVEGVLPGGALSLICVPASGWNGDLLTFAHGYTAFNEPLDFQNIELPDGTSLPELAQRLGFAFATTSYRRNGLAILEGVEDMKELVEAFPTVTGQTADKVYITGPSEGGIVTALSMEKYPELYDAGMSACGPVGSFRRQINYWADFRALWEYFFPGVVPGSPTLVPEYVINDWDSVYQPAALAAADANPLATGQLLKTSRAPIDLNDPAKSTRNTIGGLLWYNVFATNDGIEQLGGIPFDNTKRWYRGSSNDFLLNRSIQRIAADPEALEAMMPYETTGKITKPLVILHTTGDEIIPYWHEPAYRQKLVANATARFIQIPIQRYGHCNFTTPEVLVGVLLMVLQTTGTEMKVPPEYDITATRARMEKAAHDLELNAAP